MSKVFFTYVWGGPGNPAWPLTFASKAARTGAKRALSEGDFVFIVGTKNDPTPTDERGRVLGVYQVSSLEVNTQDYEEQIDKDPNSRRAAEKFPFALHPIAVWKITSNENLFAPLVGPLSGGKHLQARTTVVEIQGDAASALLALERQAVTPAKPNTVFGRGLVAQKNSKLAPKHEGDFVGSFGDHETWYVYILALRNRQNRDLAFKIGYANDPLKRRDAYRMPMASEVTDLTWELAQKQPTSSEDEARRVEQALLQKFSKNRLASNGEIITGTSFANLASALVDILRES